MDTDLRHQDAIPICNLKLLNQSIGSEMIGPSPLRLSGAECLVMMLRRLYINISEEERKSTEMSLAEKTNPMMALAWKDLSKLTGRELQAALVHATEVLVPNSKGRDVPFVELAESKVMIATFWSMKKHILWKAVLPVTRYQGNETLTEWQKDPLSLASSSLVQVVGPEKNLGVIIERMCGFQNHRVTNTEYYWEFNTPLFIRVEWKKKYLRDKNYINLQDLMSISIPTRPDQEDITYRLIAAVRMRPTSEEPDLVMTFDTHGLNSHYSNENYISKYEHDVEFGADRAGYMLYYVCFSPLDDRRLQQGEAFMPGIRPSQMAMSEVRQKVMNASIESMREIGVKNPPPIQSQGTNQMDLGDIDMGDMHVPGPTQSISQAPPLPTQIWGNTEEMNLPDQYLSASRVPQRGWEAGHAGGGSKRTLNDEGDSTAQPSKRAREESSQSQGLFRGGVFDGAAHVSSFGGRNFTQPAFGLQGATSTSMFPHQGGNGQSGNSPKHLGSVMDTWNHPPNTNLPSTRQTNPQLSPTSYSKTQSSLSVANQISSGTNSSLQMPSQDSWQGRQNAGLLSRGQHLPYQSRNFQEDRGDHGTPSRRGGFSYGRCRSRRGRRGGYPY